LATIPKPFFSIDWTHNRIASRHKNATNSYEHHWNGSPSISPRQFCPNPPATRPPNRNVASTYPWRDETLRGKHRTSWQRSARPSPQLASLPVAPQVGRRSLRRSCSHHYHHPRSSPRHPWRRIDSNSPQSKPPLASSLRFTTTRKQKRSRYSPLLRNPRNPNCSYGVNPRPRSSHDDCLIAGEAPETAEDCITRLHHQTTHHRPEIDVKLRLA
jgi:hypothetical protein